MEERLGRLGRPLSTLVLLAAALGIIAWGFHQVWSKVIGPLVRVASSGAGSPFSVDAAQSAGGIIGIVLGYLIVEYICSRKRSKVNQRETADKGADGDR